MELMLICALLPLISGAALPFLRIRNRKARMAYVLLSTCLTSGLCLYAVFFGADNPGFAVPRLLAISPGLALRWSLDESGRVYLAVASALWPLSALYAAENMRHEKREGNFFAWYTMAYGAAVMLAFSGNLFTLYVNYEFLTLLTVPLVWHKKDESSTRAVKWYMAYLFGGAALGLVSMVGLSALGMGGFLPGDGAMVQGPWLRVLALLGFVGFGVKAAVLPLCRWLPAASVAPTPVTALLHAVAVVNAGVFAVLRLFYHVIPAEAVRGTWVQTVMLVLSSATVLYGAVMAVREQHLKKRLAWSTVGNLSYMLFGLALLSREGVTAGLSHMVFHSITKIILFFCAGTVLAQTGRAQIRQMHGLGRMMPLTFGAFTLAGISLVGIPPLAGFVSKYALVTAAFGEGSVWAHAGACALIVSAILTAVYIFTVVFPAFFMKPTVPDGETIREGGLCVRLSLVLLCLLLVLCSVFAGRIIGYLAGMGEVLVP